MNVDYQSASTSRDSAPTGSTVPLEDHAVRSVDRITETVFKALEG
jgi:hypothetical protein